MRKSKEKCKRVKKSFGSYLGKISPIDYNFFLLFSLETELTSDHTFKSTENVAIT